MRGAWGIGWGKLSAVAALVIALGTSGSAGARPAGEVRHLQAAGVLVMPFDTTSGRVSFEIVSRTGNGTGGPVTMRHSRLR